MRIDFDLTERKLYEDVLPLQQQLFFLVALLCDCSGSVPHFYRSLLQMCGTFAKQIINISDSDYYLNLYLPREEGFLSVNTIFSDMAFRLRWSSLSICFNIQRRNYESEIKVNIICTSMFSKSAVGILSAKGSVHQNNTQVELFQLSEILNRKSMNLY